MRLRPAAAVLASLETAVTQVGLATPQLSGRRQLHHTVSDTTGCW